MKRSIGKNTGCGFDAPAQPSDSKKLTNERTDALRSRNMHFQIGTMDKEGDLPTLIGKLKVDWIDFPLHDILQQLTTLKEGILRGVFQQTAAGAWFGCRAEKAQITVLLPGGADLSSWLDTVDCMSHSWPKSCNISQMQTGSVHAKTFHLHRKFIRARHMWLSLGPNWNLLHSPMYTDWPGIYTSKAWWWSPAHMDWLNQNQLMWQFIDAQVEPVRITMQQALAQYETDLMDEQVEIDANKGSTGGRKRWKTKQGVYQLKDPEKLEQASPNADEATYAEMLQDV